MLLYFLGTFIVVYLFTNVLLPLAVHGLAYIISLMSKRKS